MLDEIRRLRNAGVVRCGYLEKSAVLMEVAQAFSLNDDSAHYRTITKREAETILARLLHEDLAYNMNLMPWETAWQLAQLFLGEFDEPRTRYYTNINFGTEGQAAPDVWVGPQWNPVTDATFDGGVIAIGSERAACLWVEDED